jgi:hypothetical protein
MRGRLRQAVFIFSVFVFFATVRTEAQTTVPVEASRRLQRRRRQRPKSPFPERKKSC